MKEVPKDFRVELDLKKLGTILREAREEQNLSIRELAKICGISATQLNRMELGDDFAVAKLVQVGVPLGVPPALLIDAALKIYPPLLSADDHFALAFNSVVVTLQMEALQKGFLSKEREFHELPQLIAVCASHVLLSANPEMTLRLLEVRFASLRRNLEDFIRAYGLETTFSERAAVMRSIVQKPVAKMTALKLLTPDVVREWLEDEEENISQELNNPGEQGKTETVPNASSAWSQLMARAIQATSERGAKAKLARDLDVTPQAVNQWLSGANAPSAETTLRLLEWVTAAEANSKVRPAP